LLNEKVKDATYSAVFQRPSNEGKLQETRCAREIHPKGLKGFKKVRLLKNGVGKTGKAQDGDELFQNSKARETNIVRHL
jgi:hypothetical protein